MMVTETRKRWIAVGACALTALMAVDVIYQVGMHVRWRRWIPGSLAARAATEQPPGASAAPPSATQSASTVPATAPSPAVPPDGMSSGAPGPGMMPPMPGGATSQPAKPPPVNAALKKRNVLVPAMPKGHGMMLTGVLGNTALFVTRQGQTVSIEAGKSGGDIKVLRIDGYTVTIEYQGKAETMKLFPDTRGPGPAGEPPPPGADSPGGRTPRPQTQPVTTTRATAPDTQPKGERP